MISWPWYNLSYTDKISQGLCWPEGFNTVAALDLYRERLNNLALTRQQKDDVIQVKQKVFALNDKLIAEVTSSAESKNALRYHLEKAGLVLLFFLAMYLLYRFVMCTDIMKDLVN